MKENKSSKQTIEIVNLHDAQIIQAKEQSYQAAYPFPVVFPFMLLRLCILATCSVQVIFVWRRSGESAINGLPCPSWPDTE